MTHQYHQERGNVLFYILIAVVALAALSYAVSRGSRESASTINREKTDLAATEILDYATAVRSNVQNMLIQGVKQNQICFDHPTFGTDYYYAGCDTVKNKVFDSAGAAAPAPRTPSNYVLDNSKSTMSKYGVWAFPGTIQIKGVGTDCTGSDASCNDLAAMIFPLQDEVCKSVNKKMAIDNPDNLPVNVSAITYTPYQGSFTFGAVIDATVLNGKRTGCFRDSTTGVNVFYAVLIAN